MNVPSYEFLAFAAVAALVVNVSARPMWRRWVLAIANVAFVLTFTRDPIQLAPFGVLLLCGFASVKLMESYKRGAAFGLLVVALLFAFCWLKNYTFIPHALFLPFAYLTVGMSYVFFRVLHLVIDAYQESLPGPVGFLSYVSYTLNFTSFVSGPIQLYKDYLRTEAEQPASLDQRAVAAAVERIILGFFKVSIVSQLLLFAHDRSFAALSADLTLGARIFDGALVMGLYPVYLYANFSGYMDVVIGAARFLRLELPENFNNPFVSKGFIEFWTRWHITLSNWLKTYVYSPFLLSLMRRFPEPRLAAWLGVLSYFVTFFLIGLWHGQTESFVVFGIMLGLGVSINKIYQIVMTKELGRARYRDLCANPTYSDLSRGLTFAWFSLSMLWFWSTPSQLGRFAGTLGPAELIGAFLLVVAIAAPVLALAERAERGFGQAGQPGSLLASPYLRTAFSTALLVVTVSVTVVLSAPAPHIVYRAF